MIITDTILGKADRNPLKGLDWPAVPGHFGKPWFLPLVGLYKKLSTDFGNPDAATNEKGAGMISAPFFVFLQVGQASPPMWKLLILRYSSMPHWAPSRPKPDCLIRPKPDCLIAKRGNPLSNCSGVKASRAELPSLADTPRALQALGAETGREAAVMAS